jgi:hypothetical protein
MIAQGRNGLIKIEFPSTISGDPSAPSVSATAGILGNLRSWSLDETVDTVDATVMSTSTGFIFRDVLPSFKSWTVQATVLFEDDPDSGSFVDVNDEYLRSGVTVNIYIYPEGNVGVTDRCYYGKALITSKGISSSYDGLIEVSMTFEGRDTLSVSEVA